MDVYIRVSLNSMMIPMANTAVFLLPSPRNFETYVMLHGEARESYREFKTYFFAVDGMLLL